MISVRQRFSSPKEREAHPLGGGLSSLWSKRLSLPKSSGVEKDQTVLCLGPIVVYTPAARAIVYRSRKDMPDMIKTTPILPLFLLYSTIVTAAAELMPPPHSQVASASPVITIPVMTNSPGALGGVFKTKVVVLNPTIFSFPVEVSLYGTDGFVSKTTINLAAGQVRNYENFLAEVFSFSGAGTVNFDSLSLAGGNPNLKFLVSAEVYMDSDKGRFTTVVSTGAPLDPVSPTANAYSIGITVDGDTRTNLGCFNTSFSTNVISAEVYDSTNRLVTTVALTVGGGSWTQVSLPNAVSGGYIRWRPVSAAYCYAVVVNNTSNDGTFIPAVNYLP
jgi:hypothetical protein